MTDYTKIPKEKQQARAAYTIFALSDALEKLPEDLEGTREDQALLDRIIKWQNAVCAEVGANKLPKLNAQAVMYSFGRFLKHGEKKKRNKKEKDRWLVARFWCAILFVWDVRITCPAYGRTSAWHYLDIALEKLGRHLLAAYEGANEEADNMYLELCW